MDKYFVIGKIVNTQGVKGEVRVLPSTDDVNRFKLLNEISIFKGEKSEKYKIDNIRFHKNFVLLKLNGVDNMTEAEKLKNFEIRIPEELALKCEEDEYYIRDLYGLKVLDENDTEVGVLKDIIFTGANDVYVIDDLEGNQFLIPAIKQCILDVNIDKNLIKVKILEGLR